MTGYRFDEVATNLTAKERDEIIVTLLKKGYRDHQIYRPRGWDPVRQIPVYAIRVEVRESCPKVTI